MYACVIRTTKGRYYNFTNEVVRNVQERTESVRHKCRSSNSKFCLECLSQNIMTSCDKHWDMQWEKAKIAGTRSSQWRDATDRLPVSRREDTRHQPPAVVSFASGSPLLWFVSVLIKWAPYLGAHRRADVPMRAKEDWANFLVIKWFGLRSLITKKITDGASSVPREGWFKRHLPGKEYP